MSIAATPPAFTKKKTVNGRPPLEPSLQKQKQSKEIVAYNRFFV
jgi:hypothetical protein